VTPQDNLIELTDDELESKFLECAMPEILRTCKRKSANRDPGTITTPPYTSVRHRREHGFWYLTENDELIALIFYWDDPSGAEQMSIRMFRCPDGQWYKRKARDLFTPQMYH
jgi:hypothetical protein